MKRLLSVFLLLGWSATAGAGVMDPVVKAVDETFGRHAASHIVLVKADATALPEPQVWNVFATDSHRKGQLVKIRVAREQRDWKATSQGAGNLLQKVPPRFLDASQVAVNATSAREKAAAAAQLAQAKWATVEFQLATNGDTGEPEWALFLLDQKEREVGFVVVSAVSGAVLHQEFGGEVMAPPTPAPGTTGPGAEAAQSVKKGVRKAWNWTERAGRETGNFFRELFR